MGFIAFLFIKKRCPEGHLFFMNRIDGFFNRGYFVEVDDAFLYC